MPYNKEQLRAYWAANKVILNQRRKEKRKLAKFGLATGQVSHNSPGEVSHDKVSHLGISQSLAEVSHNQPETANFNSVSHGKPKNSQLNSAVANLKLTRLIKEWRTQTNYSCPPTCLYSYCNNCWYFADQELVNYKGLYD